MDKRGHHAVVLGASMGGLLAARVLADFYDRVTVVERDSLPTGPVNRRGVPQGSTGRFGGTVSECGGVPQGLSVTGDPSGETCAPTRNSWARAAGSTDVARAAE